MPRLAQGEVALSIADDAWKVAFYISFDNGECYIQTTVLQPC